MRGKRGPPRRPLRVVPLCSLTGCTRFCETYREGRSIRKYCSMHLGRLRRNKELGPPHSLMGLWGYGTLNTSGHVQVGVNGKKQLVHRLIWEQANGPIPEGYVVHHKDGNRLNNDLGNLECMLRRDHILLHRGL